MFLLPDMTLKIISGKLDWSYSRSVRKIMYDVYPAIQIIQPGLLKLLSYIFSFHIGRAQLPCLNSQIHFKNQE